MHGFGGKSMYLNRVTVKNFRVFDDKGIDVIFHKGVNAIIGENNSGKSALIDAIRIAFSTVPYRKDIFFTKSDFHVNAQGNRAATAEIDIYFEDVPKHLIDIWNPEEQTTGEFHLRFYTDILPSGAEKVKYQAWGGKIEGNSVSSNTFDAMNIAFLGALRDAESEMKPSRLSKLANLLNTITTDENEKLALVNELREANTAILAMEPIKRTKEIINANLADIEQEVLRQQVDIGLVEPRFESITSSLRSWIVPRWYFIKSDSQLYDKLNTRCREEKLMKFIHPADGGMYFDIDGYLQSDITIEESEKEALLNLMQHSFELYQNGLGYNNLLFMSAVLGDMSLDKEGIYLNLFAIEEPEAHLHPQLQELIHNFFERRHNDSESIQVIYTSHSPTLVSRIGIKAINLLYEDNHAIRCFPLSNASLTDSEKDYLEKYLDVTKSQMFFAKGVVFVEGISEALLLPEMAKLLNRSFDKYAVEIVNIDGTSFSPFAKVLTIASGMKSFAKAVIVTDDDRCADSDDASTYISKEIDYDADTEELAAISKKLELGCPSSRFKNIESLCSGGAIEIAGSKKTLELELSLEENNISYLLDSIIKVFPRAGISLRTLVKNESSLQNKALRVWLFIRKREKYKAQIAQVLSWFLQQEIKKLAAGETIENPFTVPSYLAQAVYFVTEPEER